MKKTNILLRFIMLVMITILPLNRMQAQQNELILNIGEGNGIKFWGNTNRFKLHMGTGSEYHYGPVTDYSIKSNMEGSSGRGWTWGETGKTPIAGLNILGDFQVARNFRATGNATIGDGDWGALTIVGKRHNNWLLNAHNDEDSFHIRTNADGQSNWARILMTFKRDKQRVGIGTASPTEKLEVRGNLKINSNSSYSYIRLGKENNDAIIADNASQEPYGGGYWFRVHDEAVSYKYRDVMMLAKNGNVGIGALKPKDKLQIGNAFAFHDGGSEVIGMGYSAGNGGTDLDANAYSAEVRFVPNSGVLSLGTSTTTTGFPTRMFNILKSGNVGIGTVTPKNKLSVNGTIWSKEVKVSLTDAADWVFDADYHLKPLSEVEKYIKTHKHLPEIPSAEDFRKNDLKVSEMTNKLLQKIEELTLYTIAQEKELREVKVLKKRNAELEARMERLEQLIIK